MFKDKLQELIDKNTVELNVEMRAATTNVVFTNKDMVKLVSTQDDKEDKGNWFVTEGETTQERRLQAVTQSKRKVLQKTHEDYLLKQPLQAPAIPEESSPSPSMASYNMMSTTQQAPTPHGSTLVID